MLNYALNCIALHCIASHCTEMNRIKIQLNWIERKCIDYKIILKLSWVDYGKCIAIAFRSSGCMVVCFSQRTGATNVNGSDFKTYCKFNQIKIGLKGKNTTTPKCYYRIARSIIVGCSLWEMWTLIARKIVENQTTM